MGSFPEKRITISELAYLGLKVKRNMGADSCSSDSGLGPRVLVVHG